MYFELAFFECPGPLLSESCYLRFFCKRIVPNKIQSRGSTSLGNYTVYKRRKKTAKAKATNKMHYKVIKINDNNLK